MPLDQFIVETMSVLATDADEIPVERAKRFRGNARPNYCDPCALVISARILPTTELMKAETANGR